MEKGNIFLENKYREMKKEAREMKKEKIFFEKE